MSASSDMMTYPGAAPSVISSQPQAHAQEAPGYMGPSGLEYLSMVDHLLIKQQVEMLEVFTGWESANKYRVFNTLGQDVFFAKEDNDCCTRHSDLNSCNLHDA